MAKRVRVGHAVACCIVVVRVTGLVADALPLTQDRELTLSLQKVDYNAHDAHTVAHSVQKSARSYQSAFHPDYPRFDNKDELGRDKELAFIMRTMQPPTPRHGTLAQEVEGSPRRYSPMVSPTSRFGDDKRRSGTPPHLGPGSTTPDVDVIHRRCRWNAVPMTVAGTPSHVCCPCAVSTECTPPTSIKLGLHGSSSATSLTSPRQHLAPSSNGTAVPGRNCWLRATKRCDVLCGGIHAVTPSTGTVPRR